MQRPYMRRVGMVIIPLMLALYVAPIFIFSVAALLGNLKGGTAIGEAFLSLVVSPDLALNLFHKLLLPITAGVTVAVLWEERSVAWTTIMIAGLLITIALTVALQIYFGTNEFQLNMVQLTKNAVLRAPSEADFPVEADRLKQEQAKLAQLYTLATTFCGRIQESVITYLLILLGLQAIPTGGNAAPANAPPR